MATQKSRVASFVGVGGGLDTAKVVWRKVLGLRIGCGHTKNRAGHRMDFAELRGTENFELGAAVQVFVPRVAQVKTPSAGILVIRSGMAG